MWWSKCCRTVCRSSEKRNRACGGASVAVLCAVYCGASVAGVWLHFLKHISDIL